MRLKKVLPKFVALALGITVGVGSGPSRADNTVAYRVGPGTQQTCRATPPDHISTRGVFWCNSSDGDKPYYTDPDGASAALTTGTAGMAIGNSISGGSSNTVLFSNSTGHFDQDTTSLLGFFYDKVAHVLSVANIVLRNALSFVLTDGSYTHTVALGNLSSGNLAQIVSGDPAAYSNYYFNYQCTPNVHGPADCVYGQGTNCGAGGGILTFGLGGFCSKNESNFEWDPGGHPGETQGEIEWSTYDLSGLENRIFAVNYPHISTPPSPSPATALQSEEWAMGASARLFIYAEQISIGPGLNNNGPVAVGINPTTTDLRAPSQNETILLDDNDQQIDIAAVGTGGIFASVIADGANGIVLVNSSAVTRLASSNNVGVEVGASSTQVLQPDDHTNFMQVDGNGVYSYAGGNLRLAVGAGGVSAPTFLTTPHVLSSGSAPTATVQAGLGAGASCSIVSGTDGGGLVRLTSGAAVTASAALCVVNFATAYPVAPHAVVIAPANAAAAALGASSFFVSTTATASFTVSSDANITGLGGATYDFWYWVIG
jgi:hypothetical protein